MATPAPSDMERQVARLHDALASAAGFLSLCLVTKRGLSRAALAAKRQEIEAALEDFPA